QRAGVAMAVLLVCGVTAYVILWGSYGFRFAPSPEHDRLLNFQRLVADASYVRLQAMGHSEVEAGRRVRDLPLNLPTRVNRFLHENRLLPNSYASGFQFVQSRSAYRDGYLLGEFKGTGWWYYYPVVMAAKT